MATQRQLRCSIRAPARFGAWEPESETSALLTSMHQARESSTATDVANPGSQNLPSSGRAVKIVAKPEIAEFDPTLPPATFSTLPKPRTKCRKTHHSKSIHPPAQLAVDWTSSNCWFNPTYENNMLAMEAACEDEYDETDNLSLSDSDDESTDDQRALGLKTIDPLWSNLSPAIQLTIAFNLLKFYSWENMCTRLEINREDRAQLAHYLKTSNEQISREDKALAQMRKKQLTHIMNIDEGIVKQCDVPYQFVLKQVSKETNETTNEILKTTNPKLEFCRPDDIQAARKFLRKRNLNEGLAGKWCSPMADLSSSANHIGNHELPERFQWSDEWTLPENKFINSQRMLRDCAPGNSFQKMPSFVKSMCSKKGPYATINPRDSFRGDVDPNPFNYWKEHTPFYLRDEFQGTRIRNREHARKEMSSPLDVSESTRVQVGSRQEARLSFAYRDQPFERLVQTAKRVEFQEAELRKPHVPLPGCDETPCKTDDGAQQVSQLCDDPVKRSLGGCWSLHDVHPSESQSRYERKIEEARLEYEREKLRGQTETMEAPFMGASSYSKYPAGFSDETSYIHPHNGFSDEYIPDLPGLSHTFANHSSVQSSDSRMLPCCGQNQRTPSFNFSDNTIPAPYQAEDQSVAVDV